MKKETSIFTKHWYFIKISKRTKSALTYCIRPIFKTITPQLIAETPYAIGKATFIGIHTKNK